MAQANFWSLEDLELKLLLASDDSAGASSAISFGISQVALHGAQQASANNKLRISRSSVIKLDKIRLQWQLKKANDVKSKVILLPIYLNSDRTEILVNVEFELEEGQEEKAFVETGVAFLANL